VDHTLSVTGDCNTIKGNYTIDKNTVSGLESEDEMSIGEMKVTAAAMTKKYCEGSKESAFLSDFSKTYAYDMRPLQLNLILPNNQGVMIFERKLSTQG
jgi:heat shock protein HslJ